MTYSLFAPPGVGDVVSMVLYVLADPYMFIGSTTVMTTGLIGTIALLAGLVALPVVRRTRAARSVSRLLDWLAPKLALVLLYFGVGSMVLATEILVRFHGVDPLGTEIQFRSGLGHLVVAMLGIAVLSGRLRDLGARTWLDAHFWALAYLTLHVVVFTPPWFDFQLQGPLVSTIARGGLAALLASNVALWHATGAIRAARPA